MDFLAQELHVFCRLGAESIGKPVTIKDIGKTRIGKVAMCTQQLENFVPWLEDWVAYHMSMGVSQVHLFKGQVCLRIAL